MTEEHLQDLIRYRIERAREMFKENYLVNRACPVAPEDGTGLSCLIISLFSER